MALAAVAGMAGEWAPVPENLERLAQAKMRLALMDGGEAKVNMHGHHPLAKWGRNKRKEKLKAKIAAASRRRNRK